MSNWTTEWLIVGGIIGFLIGLIFASEMEVTPDKIFPTGSGAEGKFYFRGREIKKVLVLLGKYID